MHTETETPTEAKVVETIRRYFVDELLDDPQAQPPGPDDDLLDSELLDSVGAVRLAAHLEAAYGVSFSPLDFTFENFATVASIAALTRTRLAEHSAATA